MRLQGRLCFPMCGYMYMCVSIWLQVCAHMCVCVCVWCPFEEVLDRQGRGGGAERETCPKQG